jgi:hypothetical protein
MGRITFLLSCLLVVFLSGVALRLTHSHPGSKRVLFAAGYGVALLGVFWTRSLESRLKDAGLPRWTFWPYFLIVFTGCLGALALKFTNSLETLGLFLVLQLPALVFSGNPAPAVSLPQGTNAQKTPPAPTPKKAKPARPITPLGAIEFAVYVVLIAGLAFVLHLLRGDLAGLAMPRAWRIALDVTSALLGVPWILCVRGRFRSLGLTYWYPAFCSFVLVACVLLFALGVINFQHALILFAVLQIPAVILRREFIPAGLVEVEASEEVDTDS